MSDIDVSVIGYGDLGSLVGQTLTNLGEGLYREGLLRTILCRDVEQTSLPLDAIICPIPLGNTIPKAMKGFSRYVCEFDSRGYAERLFDVAASRYLTDDIDVLYCYIPGYVRSMKAVGETPTVVQSGTELAIRAQQRRSEELVRLGVDRSTPAGPTPHHERRHRSLLEADHVVAQSQFVRSSLESAGVEIEKIRVIPPGVDTERFQPGGPGDGEPFSALYVGQINVLKGIPYLFDAWSRFTERRDSKLVLCGGTSATMQRLLPRWELSDVRRPGFVDPLPYYRDASVFVFPSLSDGFGKAPLEAMSCGCPVIVTENTGMADLLTDGQNGYVIPPGDADAIAERIEHLYANPDERERIGEEARRTAEQYDWNRYIDEMSDFLRAEMGSSGPSDGDGKTSQEGR